MSQDEPDYYCLSIGLEDCGFYLQCISNTKLFFNEAVSPKKKFRVFLDRKVYTYALLVAFTVTLPDITIDHFTGKKISYQYSKLHNSSTTNLRSPFNVLYRIICIIRIKLQALKAK